MTKSPDFNSYNVLPNFFIDNFIFKSKEYKSIDEPSKKLYIPNEIKSWDFIYDIWFIKFFVGISFIQLIWFGILLLLSKDIFELESDFISCSICNLSSVVKYNRYNAFL